MIKVTEMRKLIHVIILQAGLTVTADIFVNPNPHFFDLRSRL